MRSEVSKRGAFFAGLAFAVFFAGAVAVGSAAAEVPPRKLELIRQAMTSMKLDGKIQAMIDQRVEGRVQKLRIENPGLPDSTAARAREVVRGVYAEARAGRDGLDAKVHEVFDRHLTEEDLRFATNFKASDNGKRYREVAPRIVNESVEAGRRWAERLEPEVKRRLEAEFRGENLRL